jgi:hypothetical protein
MQCPECGSNHIRKNGKMRGQQNHICVDCSRQFIGVYIAPQGYSFGCYCTTSNSGMSRFLNDSLHHSATPLGTKPIATNPIVWVWLRKSLLPIEHNLIVYQKQCKYSFVSLTLLICGFG